MFLSDNFAEISNLNCYFNEIPSENLTENEANVNYHCNVCNISFESESILRKHACQSEGKKNLQCPRCLKTFKRTQGLSSHKKICNPDHNLCKKCNIKFDNKNKYYNHLFSHKEKIYKCEFCEKIFYKPNVYAEHKKIHKEKSHVCDVCNSKFHFKSNLRNHMKTKHSKEKPFKCEICFVSYHEKYLLKKHINKHTKEISYLCEYCGKLYYDSKAYKSHLRSHGDKLYTCLLCNKKFREAKLLNAHRKKHSQPKSSKCKKQSKTGEKKKHKQEKEHKQVKEKKHKQDLNPKKLFQPSSLFSLAMKSQLNGSAAYGLYLLHKLHTAKTFPTSTSFSQSQEKLPKSCETSESSLLLSPSMNVHFNNSSNTMFKCEICSASFESSSLLERHKENLEHNNTIDLETHWWTRWEPPTSKKKQLKANTLEIRRLQYNQFLKHCRSFENMSKYVCGLCEDTFSSIINLNLHLLSHKDESCSLCMICEASFSCTYELIEHCLKILNDEHYLCKTCVEKFEKSDELVKHLEEKHAQAFDDPKKYLFPEHDCSIKPSTFCKETFNFMASLNQPFTISQGVHLKAIQISSVVQQRRFQCEHCLKTFILACELVKHKLCCCDLCNKTFDCEQYVLQHRVLHNKPFNVSLDVNSINCDKCHETVLDKDKFHLHNCGGKSLSYESKSNFNCENILDTDANQEDSYSKILNDGGDFNNSMSKSTDQVVDLDSDDNTIELNLDNHCNDSNQNLDSEINLIEDEYSSTEKNSQSHDFDKSLSCQGSSLNTTFNDKKCHSISFQKLKYVQFEKHLKSYENNTKFDCGLCKKSFCSNIDLNEHLPSHNDENLTSCTICKASFSCTLELIGHCLNILNNEHFLCKHCRKIFESQDELDRHLKTKDIHFCCYCNKSYLHKDSLQYHVRKEHCKKEQSLFMCVKCFKIFLLFPELMKHKSSTCNVCRENFDCESALKQHQVLHNNFPDTSQQISENYSTIENFQETSTNQQGSTFNSLDNFMNLNRTSNHKELLSEVSKLDNSLKAFNHKYNCNDDESVLKLVSHESSSNEKNIEKHSNKSIFMDVDSILERNTYQQDSAQNFDGSKILSDSLDSSIRLNNFSNFNEESVPESSEQLDPSNYSCERLESEPMLIDLKSSSIEQNVQNCVSDKTSCFLNLSLDTKPDDKSVFLCVMCDKMCVNKWSFKQHMLKEHPVKQAYTCDHCEEKFSYVSVYKNHLASHKLN